MDKKNKKKIINIISFLVLYIVCFIFVSLINEALPAQQSIFTSFSPIYIQMIVGFFGIAFICYGIYHIKKLGRDVEKKLSEINVKPK